MTSQEQANRIADIVLECNRLAKVVARVRALVDEAWDEDYTLVSVFDLRRALDGKEADE